MISGFLPVPSMVPCVIQRRLGVADGAGAADRIVGVGERGGGAVAFDDVSRIVGQRDFALACQRDRPLKLKDGLAKGRM